MRECTGGEQSPLNTRRLSHPDKLLDIIVVKIGEDASDIEKPHKPCEVMFDAVKHEVEQQVSLVEESGGMSAEVYPL